MDDKEQYSVASDTVRVLVPALWIVFCLFVMLVGAEMFSWTMAGDSTFERESRSTIVRNFGLLGAAVIALPAVTLIVASAIRKHSKRSVGDSEAGTLKGPGSSPNAGGFLNKLDSTFAGPVYRLERSPFFQFVAICAGIITFAGLIYTMNQIRVDLNDRQAERVERRDEKINREWENFTDPSSTANVRIRALNYLVTVGENLDGLDFSCHQFGRRSVLEENCAGEIALFNPKIQYSQEDDGGINVIRDWSIENIVIVGGVFSNVNLINTKFDSTIFAGTELNNVGIIIKNGSHLTCNECNMVNISIYGENFYDPKNRNYRIDLSGTNMSGSQFEDSFVHLRAHEFGRTNWSWADSPAIFVAEGFEDDATGIRFNHNVELRLPPKNKDGEYIPFDQRDARGWEHPVVSLKEARSLFPDSYDVDGAYFERITPYRDLIELPPKEIEE